MIHIKAILATLSGFFATVFIAVGFNAFIKWRLTWIADWTVEARIWLLAVGLIVSVLSFVVWLTREDPKP